MNLHAGKLREKIKVTKEERTQTDTGGFENETVTVLKTYAAVKEKTASADVIASQENVTNLIEIYIRYRPDAELKNGYTVHWRDFTFKLNNFTVDPLRRFIKITAKSEIETAKR